MTNLSILVADDDPVIRRLLEERLKNADYQVMVAEDGYQASDFLKQECFDVVLTDLVMPGDIGGIEVLEITKELHPETEVVLITAHSSVDTAVAAMKKGAADYLEKPINFDELLLRMEKITNLKKILRNAQDLGQAMTVTETEAASTIQDLEMRVTKIQAVLDKVETILENENETEFTRIREALNTLAEQ
jgi:two-component system, OmpR family, response regulator